MRIATFTVPTEVIADFCETLIETGLSHKITEVTDDQDIVFSIYFKASETQSVDSLEELFDELTGNDSED